MKSNKQFPTATDIKRLNSLYIADKSFFYLSIYSIIEQFIRLEILEPNDRFKYSFNDNDYTHEEGILSKFSNYVKTEYNLKLPNYISLRDGYKQSNIIRHNFFNIENTKSAIDEKVAISNLYEFAKFADFSVIKEIEELKNKVAQDWVNRVEDNSDYLKELVQSLRIKNNSRDGLLQKIDKISKLKNEKSELNCQIFNLKKEHEAELEKIDEENSEKLKSLEEKYKEKLAKLEEQNKALQNDYEKLSDAEEHLEILQKIASYTRTRNQFETSMKKLTPEQQKIVDGVDFEKDFLVRGSAGTGKSIVLLEILKRYVEEVGSKSVKFLAFSKTLSKYNNYIADILEISGLDADTIVTSDSFLKKITDEVFEKDFKPCEIVDFAKNSSNKIDFNKYKPILNQLLSEVLQNGLLESDYVKLCKTEKIDKETAQKNWKLIQEFFADLENLKKEVPLIYGLYKIITEDLQIPEQLFIDNLFIDEVQDLDKVKLKVLSKITRQKIFMAGDDDQSIFRHKFTWSSMGIDLKSPKRSIPLTLNFRNSIQINEIAEKYRKTYCDKTKDKSENSHSLRMGPPVYSCFDDNEDKLIEKICDDTRLFIEKIGIEPENICIIVQAQTIFTKNYLEKIMKTLNKKLKSLNISSKIISDAKFDFKENGVIRISGAMNCKGIDSPVVLYFANHRQRIAANYSDEDIDLMTRKMIYTSLTRASEFLNVYMLDRGELETKNKPFADLKSILLKENK